MADHKFPGVPDHIVQQVLDAARNMARAQQEVRAANHLLNTPMATEREQKDLMQKLDTALTWQRNALGTLLQAISYIPAQVPNP